MSWETWLQGLLAAVVSTFASAASGAIGLPTVFTFDKNGLINMVKLATVPALLAFFAYLKQNPTPALRATVDAKGNVKVQGNPVAEVTVEGKPNV
jgi:hypothetical protein